MDMNLPFPDAKLRAVQPERIVFFEKCALMGVELLDLLENYTLIVHDEDAAWHLLKQAFPLLSYGHADLAHDSEPDMAVQRMLGDGAFLAQIGVSTPRPGATGALLFRFQANSQLDALVQAGKMALLVAPSTLQARLGSKLYLPTLRAALGDALVPLVPSKVFADSAGTSQDAAAIFAACAAQWGLPLIVQGGQGAGGRDTFLIETADQLAQALLATQGQIRARATSRASRAASSTLSGTGHLPVAGRQLAQAQRFAVCAGYAAR